MTSQLDRAHQNLLDTIHHRMKCAAGLWLEGEGWCIYDLGAGTSDSHLAGASIDPDGDAATLLQTLQNTPLQSRDKTAIRVHPQARAHAAPVLERAGFQCEEDAGYPIMSIDHPVVREVTHRVELIPLTSDGEQLVAQAEPVFRSGFTTLTPAETGKMLARGVWTSDPHWRIGVARDESGRVVATGMLTRAPGSRTAGLYYIATDAQFRGRGYAKDLCTLLTNQAFEDGADLVILQASTLGEFVYRHLGYVEIGRYFPYSR
ncbi:MAG: GNAT family N-acetyltransferase [Actinomycetaceae bacterium]|nr:GNAT family N-acetyltransferase [Actinomycetaceae bacterium]